VKTEAKSNDRFGPRRIAVIDHGATRMRGGAAVALLERRQTRLSRQLSTFLADASLARDASDSLEEMLRLVAEQARELIGADCCVATVAVGGVPRTAEAASYREDERRWTAVHPMARSARDLPCRPPERRIGEDRRRAVRSPASLRSG
jgi:hypothetical protein